MSKQLAQRLKRFADSLRGCKLDIANDPGDRAFVETVLACTASGEQTVSLAQLEAVDVAKAELQKEAYTAKAGRIRRHVLTEMEDIKKRALDLAWTGMTQRVLRRSADARGSNLAHDPEMQQALELAAQHIALNQLEADIDMNSHRL